MRPNALQIKFPQREQLSFPEPLYCGSKGASMCACIVLPDERKRARVVRCPPLPEDDISHWGSWCFLDFLGLAWNRKNFPDRVLGWLFPPSLNDVFEELPWRTVGSRGVMSDEDMITQVRESVPSRQQDCGVPGLPCQKARAIITNRLRSLTTRSLTLDSWL